MLGFEHNALPVRVVFGTGAAHEKLAEIVDGLPARRVLVIAAAAEERLARQLVAPFSERVAGLFTEAAEAQLVADTAPDRSAADIEALLLAAWRGDMPSTLVRTT